MHYDHRTKARNEGAIVRYEAVVAALRGKRHEAAVKGNRGAVNRDVP